jgi:hypothetical protein
MDLTVVVAYTVVYIVALVVSNAMDKASRKLLSDELKKKKPEGFPDHEKADAVLDAVSKKADAAASSQLNFQTPATTIMEKIVDLHHDLMFFIIVVVVFVS